MEENNLKAELLLHIILKSQGDLDAALHEFAEYFLSSIVLISNGGTDDDKIQLYKWPAILTNI